MKDKAPLENAGTKQDEQTTADFGDDRATSVVAPDYLSLTENAEKSSTTWMTANLRTQWEMNIDNFRSRHTKGSKYRSPNYINRSRLFRPKTRISIRQNEAAVMSAFFSSSDVLVIKAEDDNDEKARIAADVMTELVNYRLKKNIEWMKLVVGAFQDTQVYGTCPTRVDWEFEERPTGNKIATTEEDADGNVVYIDEMETVKDQPTITPIPNENFMIDPGANWLDPINSSPYLIEATPMHIKDAKKNMVVEDGKTGRPKWFEMTDAQLQAAAGDRSYDSTRQAREGKREDSTDNSTAITDFTMVWIYRVTMDIDGVDMVWWTLGTQAMLTDPVPLSEIVVGGYRNYVLGQCIIETHRNYPSGLVELGQEMQAAANDNLNLRFDNVRLGLNSRHFVRRAGQVDLKALKKSVSGGLVMVGDMNDVKPIETKDVTSSSYAETDRFNADFDDIMGSFSGGSIQTNRSMNETVGGMGMLRDNSNIMTEYPIRVFAETWVEKVLRMVVQMEKDNETDQEILKLCADRAKVKAGTEITSEMLAGDVELEVSVGFGATDPQRQLLSFNMALDSAAKLGPAVMGKLNNAEVVKEIFGKAGYKNGARFFDKLEKDPDNPEPPPPPNPAEQIEMEKLAIKRDEIAQKAQTDFNGQIFKREEAFAKMALEKGLKLGTLYEELGIKQETATLDREKHNLGIVQEQNRKDENQLDRDELTFKATTGESGI